MIIVWQFHEIRLTIRQCGDKLMIKSISFIKLIQWMHRIWLLTEKCGIPQGNQICRMPTVWATFVELQVLPFLLYRKLTSCKVKNAPRGCAKTHSLFLYKRQEKDIRTAGVKRRCVCKKEIMGKCQRDYEKTVMVCGWTITDNEMWWQGGKSYVSWRVYGIM